MYAHMEKTRRRRKREADIERSRRERGREGEMENPRDFTDAILAREKRRVDRPRREDDSATLRRCTSILTVIRPRRVAMSTRGLLLNERKSRGLPYRLPLFLRQPAAVGPDYHGMYICTLEIILSSVDVSAIDDRFRLE